MPRLSWPVAPNGRYLIDLSIGGVDLVVMVDTGIADPMQRVGFDLDERDYDRLRSAGLVRATEYRKRHDASGRVIVRESGEVTAQLIDPATRQRVGPLVTVYANRGVKGVVSRVGPVFFHALTGCRVVWELDRKEWCVEYP